jgi:hypothetical protein
MGSLNVGHENLNGRVTLPDDLRHTKYSYAGYVGLRVLWRQLMPRRRKDY